MSSGGARLKRRVSLSSSLPSLGCTGRVRTTRPCVGALPRSLIARVRVPRAMCVAKTNVALICSRAAGVAAMPILPFDAYLPALPVVSERSICILSGPVPVEGSWRRRCPCWGLLALFVVRVFVLHVLKLAPPNRRSANRSIAVQHRSLCLNTCRNERGPSLERIVPPVLLFH